MNYFFNRNKNIKQEPYSNIKIEYHDPTDTGRVVSQTFSHPQGQGEPLSKVRKILRHVENSGNNFPKIAIKREIKSEQTEEVILVNGCWDTSNKIPNLVAEMHNVQTEELSSFQNFFKGSNGESNNSGDLVSPSPRGSDSGIESDCADGNLSWLLNYKIQELPPVPDSASSESLLNDAPRIINVVKQKPVNEVIISEGYKAMNLPKNNGSKKPPFTYTELIEHALCEKGELTVSGIYNWISQHFPYYKANDDRWKNSVRHNLSINPHFRKGSKAIHGAGHLWTIAQKDESKTWQMKQRIDDFIRTSSRTSNQNEEQDAFDKELQAATESILGEIQGQNTAETIDTTTNMRVNNQHSTDLGISNEHSADLGINNEHPTDLRMTSQQTNDEIHVEFINMPEGTTGLEDFLAPPVSKQDLVNECGLGSDFFITDINPNQLGLNLTEAENTEDDIYDEMSFEYYGMKE